MSQALPKATITRREDVTPDLWKIWLKPEVPFKFKPGQYCTIGFDDVERAYAIVSSPYEEQLELFIELVPLPYGILTPLLCELGVSCRVTIRPRAKGVFTLDERYSHHLMIVDDCHGRGHPRNDNSLTRFQNDIGTLELV